MKFRGDSKNFVKLKSGESITGIFRGDPYEFYQHYDPVTKRSDLCSGTDCQICKQVDEKGKPKKPGFRFRLNFLTLENGQYVAKTFDQGWRVYEVLRAMHSTGQNLEKMIVKITRYGTDQQTQYQITPLAEGQVNEMVEKKLKQVKLNDLSHATPVQREPGEDEADIPN